MMFQSNGFASLPRTNPLSQQVSEIALKELFASLEQKAMRMRGIMVLRGGKVIGEKYWHPYHSEDKVWVYSLSKNFTATAVGLAVDEGLLSLDDKVISFFPNKCPENISDNLAAMRLRDLLSMTAGHHEDTMMHLMLSPDGDWIKSFLSLPVEHKPGTWFRYNSGASFMAMAILEKIAEENVLNYLAPRLFEPMGFDDVMWDETPTGIATGGWGIMVRLEDAAKLGLLYLNRGVYDGRRILSENWVEQATQKQADNSENPDNEGLDWRQGYGFQFWRCRHGAYRGDGAYGQFLITLPQQDAVIAIMSETFDMAALQDVVWDVLLPAFDTVSSTIEESINGKQYVLDNNPMGLRSVSFLTRSDSIEMHFMRNAEDSITLKTGRSDWMDNNIYLPFGYPTIAIEPTSIQKAFHKQSVRCSWLEENILFVEWLYLQSPHASSMKCVFKGDRITLVWPPNSIAAYISDHFNISLNGAKELSIDGVCQKQQ